MSYDIRIKNKQTNETVTLDELNILKGGTYPVNGTNQARFNITYNYYDILSRVLGDKSVRELYGKDIGDTQQLLWDAYNSLPNEGPDENYWKCTEGNVRVAIKSLIELAENAMKSNPTIEMVWDGD